MLGDIIVDAFSADRGFLALQPSLWDALLSEQAERPPARLEVVDVKLDDERFIAPWRALLDGGLAINLAAKQLSPKPPRPSSGASS